MARKKKTLTRGERMCAFIERHCVVPEGNLVGKPVKLEPFQRKFILEIYDNPHGTDTAILTMARKNAKTATIAFIVLGHLVGPESIQNSRIVSGAMSKEQAAEVFNLASKCVNLSPTLRDNIRIIPSGKRLIGLPMNVEYQATSAEGKTAHGKSPVVAILDEVGQIRGPQSDFVDAITTAQGAYDNPLLIYISTQAANDADFFSILIDDALKNKPKKTVCHVYAADPDAKIMDKKQWKKANPALGKFRSAIDMQKQAEKAARMPSFENTFRNLNLNQRVSTASPVVSPDVWKACAAKPYPLADCEYVYGGLDLSSRLDLSAFVLVGWHAKSKTWNAHCWFWTPEEGLMDREKRDRAPYLTWVQQGYLSRTPGASINYEFVAHEIAEITSDLTNLHSIAFDRWRIDILKNEFERMGYQPPLEPWGQGFKDMSPAIDTFEEIVINKSLRHGGNPVLTMCVSNGRITRDPAGNRKLDKMKNSGRIDGLVALAMAQGIAERKTQNEGGSLDEFLASPIVIP